MNASTTPQAPGRREFLKSTVLAALAAGGASLSAADAPPTSEPSKAMGRDGKPHPFNPRTPQAMPMHNFGKTGYRVGIFSLGCQAAVEEKGKEAVAEAILNRALDLGVNYFDTAAVYGGGVSETNVGRVMKTRRKEVWLSTKVAKRGYEDGKKQIEESLQRLQTDHVDSLQLHNVQRMDDLEKIFAPDGVMKAIEQFRDQGMVRHVGITGHFEPLVLVEALKRYKFDSLLLALNAADTHYLSFIRYLLPEALRQGIATIGMKVCTRGKLIQEFTPPPLEQQPERMRSAKRGTLTMKEAIYYNMTLPVSTTIIGCDTVEHVEQNVKWASEFSPLNDEQMRELEYRTLPIVRQSLYFRRWDLGA